jgi:hypothetical protein
MGFQIQDGTGKGYVSGVNSKNRLLTSTINETTFQYGAEIGDAYFIGTPQITATTAGSSAIFFLENNEDMPLILGNFLTIAEATAGGSPNIYRLIWYKNPTSITSGTTTTPLNQNFGSSNELDCTAQYGVQGSVVNGGTVVTTLSLPIGQFNNIEANLVLEKGSSFAVVVIPPAGNTSMAVQFAARAILFDRN